MTKQASQEEFLKNKNHNPQDGQDGWDTPKTYTEEEYTNLQAFWTKAQQERIALAWKLASKDPKELLNMDASIQNKVVKEIWGYENLDELKVMLPDLFDDNDGDDKWSSDDVVEQMKREQQLLRMKLEKKEINDEIEKFSSSNSDLVNSIPNFTEKVNEELKNISSNLPAKERVTRATKLVAGNSDLSVEAYLQLQWKNNIKANNKWVSDDYIKDAQNALRKSLWLKIK